MSWFQCQAVCRNCTRSKFSVTTPLRIALTLSLWWSFDSGNISCVILYVTFHHWWSGDRCSFELVFMRMQFLGFPLTAVCVGDKSPRR